MKKEMKQLWKESGILEDWKFHDIFVNACAPTKQLVLQHFTKAVSHISPWGHAHLAVLPAAASCLEPRLCSDSWACHRERCRAAHLGWGAAAHLGSDSVWLPCSPWCAAALGKELLKCFREWHIPMDAGTHPSGFVVCCWFSSDLSLCFLSFCLCFFLCSALEQGASSHLPAHMQPLLLLPGRNGHSLSVYKAFAAATSLAMSLHTLQSLFQLKPLPGTIKNCVWWGCGQHGKRKLRCMLSPHL